MARSARLANPQKEPRLTSRQREVLSRVARGKPVAPEVGKRLDLTLNSLITRGLIEASGQPAPDEPAVYRATAAGLKPLEVRPKTEKGTAERYAPKAARKGAPGAGEDYSISVGGRGVPRVEEVGVEERETEVEEFEPRVGQRVWNLDWRGRRKRAIYRVDQVGVDDVQLSVWSGHSFKPVAERQGYSSLVPLSDEELAAAIRDGMPQG